MKAMKGIFFPDRTSVFGSTDRMTFALGNFRCEEIVHDNFTLVKYITKHKLTKVRLYILSKASSEKFEYQQKEVIPLSDDDSDLMTSAFEDKQGTSQSQLLGSSEDRESLRIQQEREYLECLATDREKEKEKRQELLLLPEKTARQESLRDSRAKRVPFEPPTNAPHITVSVRHLTLGIQMRRFDNSGQVGSVYDWVGSLSLEPEYFTLSMPDNANISPALPIETVNRVMLSMAECAETPSFPDDDICFKGFGSGPEENHSSYSDESDETTEPLSRVSDKPPHVLMKEDEDLKDVESPGEDDQGVEFTALNIEAMHAGFSTGGSLDTNEGSSPLNSSDDEFQVEEAATNVQGRRGRRASPGYQFRQRYLQEVTKFAEVNEAEEQSQRNISHKRMDILEKLLDLGETKQVTIDRENIVENMLRLYSKGDVTECLLNVNFYNESAVDFDGVKREAFTLFWEKVLPIYFDGINSYVPRISPAIDETVYISLGRILSHGFLMVGVFPTSLNKIFISALLVGKQHVSDQNFLEGFLDYISSYDSLRMQKILDENNSKALSNEDTDFLVDFLSEYGVTKLPNASNLRAIVLSVAKTELWNKVVMAADAMKQGLCEGMLKELWLQVTNQSVFELYSSLRVTTEKVLSLVSVDNPSAMTKGQHIVYMYFRRYVRCLNERELTRLLRFVTGSSTPTVSSIKVIFHAQLGNLPHVTVHACSGVVDLPSSGYDSFPDFRSQMTEVLKNVDSWRFSLA
ncbi:uncharacterized protein [Montipora capricornis]|uniref:uncharacterized protein n=1 Tax=Montipora capricornis TaxID=246305 RepID=UPI0035F1EF1A